MPATTMLDLPRELYLEICHYLSSKDLSRMTGVSKDHYLAAQQPLYRKVTITSLSSLVKLVAAITKPPTVSTISRRQRLRWQSLSDAQLREREISHLEIVLENRRDGVKTTGAVLSRCIGAISRTNNDVRITLHLYGSWYSLLRQLHGVALPDVRGLRMFLGEYVPPAPQDRRNPYMHLNPGFELWDLCFDGSCFTDLQDLEVNTMHTSLEEVPKTLEEAANVGRSNFRNQYNQTTESFSPFFGLKKMKSIKLNYNTLLNVGALDYLFGSNIIPQRLSRLEIVNCPGLSSIRSLESLATLIQRGLQLLQHLKLHLQPSGHRDCNQHEYWQEIAEHPDWHICNIVREMGSKIKSLDLALPWACSKLFSAVNAVPRTRHDQLQFPDVCREPYGTLPNRLLAAGYRHRRLICWHGHCRHAHDDDEEHEWQVTKEWAIAQDPAVSWELASVYLGDASWTVGGCLPHAYSAREVLHRELTAAER